MMKILKSVSMIAAVAAIAGGATYAYFSDKATVTNNTFSAGTLDIRVDGEPSIVGFNVQNAIPGTVVEKQFTLQNYGQPYFSGSSTVSAKKLLTTAVKKSGNPGELFNALTVSLYANAGWGGCSNPGVSFVAGKGCEVYKGPLSGLSGVDILHATQWGATPSLAAGSSLTMTLDAELPETGGDQSTLQGMLAQFDLSIEGRSN
ncbi:MAG: hypothetical protein HGB37_00030 [Candidatus Moranbacteria bacterium]|nr:hypothetical protein [Candidatus Moranbacteria bacterium]